MRKEEERKERAFEMLDKGFEPTLLQEGVWKFSSQTGYGWYQVKTKGTPSCECPDHKYRHLVCKHIFACQLYDAIQTKVSEKEEEGVVKCFYCESKEVVGHGFRETESGKRKRFKCNGCGKTFVENEGFKHLKGSPEMVLTALDLYFKGLSLRKIADHFVQFKQVKVSPSTVLRWTNDYMALISEYVKDLKPEVSARWHADEMMVKAGGKWLYVWNCMDAKTRFILSERVTKSRENIDAQNLFKMAKEKAGKTPEIIITDKLEQYKNAFAKEFLPRGRRFSFRHESKHYAYKGFPDKANNNLIERFHGTMRERNKVQRGLQNLESANRMMRNLTTYYNFLRPHSALNGKTPSEQAGIKLDLKESRWLNLITKSGLIKG
jgi:transposase-like protein